MKKILLLLMLMPIVSNAQNREKFDTVNPIYQDYLPIEDGVITYTEVIQVEGVSQGDLYLKANDWIVKTFNSPKDVIQFNDKEAGKIICKTITGVDIGKGLNRIQINPIYYLISIETREGRYKITASDFIHVYNVGLLGSNVENQNNFEKYFLLKNPNKRELDANMKAAQVVYDNIQALFDSAEIALTQSKNDDW